MTYVATLCFSGTVLLWLFTKSRFEGEKQEVRRAAKRRFLGIRDDGLFGLRVSVGNGEK